MPHTASTCYKKDASHPIIEITTIAVITDCLALHDYMGKGCKK